MFGWVPSIIAIHSVSIAKELLEGLLVGVSHTFFKKLPMLCGSLVYLVFSYFIMVACPDKEIPAYSGPQPTVERNRQQTVQIHSMTHHPPV